MTHLSNEALLRIAGPGTGQFLQGQSTANFDTAIEGSLLRGAFCDPKGRILGDFLAAILKPQEEVILRTRAGVADHLEQHLQRYIAFSKATLERLDWTVGAAAIDSTPAELKRLDSGWVVPRGLGLTEYWSPVQENPGELTEEEAKGQEIALGEARVETETIGRYLPQDLNYDLNGAVSFEKGCYTGQEIVARLHYRGTPKRRLYRALVESKTCPGIGAPLVIAEKEQPVGSIVNSGLHAHGRVVLIEAIDNALDAGLTVQGSGAALLRWPSTA